MRKTKPIELSPFERERLLEFISSGKALARHIKHAHVLLKLAEGWSNLQIAQTFDLTEKTVITLRKRFQTEGLEACLKDKARSGAPPKIDGVAKAVVVATACSKAPSGHAHWTLRLLADKMVELEVVEGISPNTIRAILKKTN
jgi:transposase